MQVERPMRLAAVQVDRHGRDRHMCGDQRVGEDLPAAQIEQAGIEEAQDALDHGMIDQVLNSMG